MSAQRPKLNAKKRLSEESDEYFSAEEQQEEPDTPSEDYEEEERPKNRRQSAKSAKRPRASPALKEEDEPVLMPTGKKQQGRRSTGPGARRRRSGGEDGGGTGGGAGPGPGSAAGGRGGAGRAAPARVPQIPVARGEVAKMNEKIQKYQEDAVEAETKLASKLSVTEYESLVGKVVRMMVFKQHEKPGVPVKRQELLEACTSEYGKRAGGSQIPSWVIKVAQAKIISTLGIEMHELSRVAVVSGKKKGLVLDKQPSVTATYVLRSVLPRQMRRELVDDPADDQAQGFKAVVLALIHLNGGRMEEGELWRHLRMLGAGPDDKEHPHFGKTGDVLRELEKTRHVVCSQQQSATGAEYFLEWGENAGSEFGPQGVQTWIEQEFGKAPGFGSLPGMGAGASGGGGR